VKNKKLLFAAAPLVLGGLIYLSLSKLDATGSKGSAPKMGTASAPPIAPPDKLHEKLGLEQELKKKPGHPPILMRLSELAREKGDLKESARYLKELVEVEPKNTEARLELGRTLYEIGDVQGAISETGKIIEQNPKHTDALYNLGAIYGNLNREDKAREYWEKAVAAAPQSDGGRKSANALKLLKN
jgi:Flp pilus assembly protein TadD